MTAEEKKALSRFLNLAADYANGGHAKRREEPRFFDGGADEPSPGETREALPGGRAENANLPLAYTVEEPPDWAGIAESREAEAPAYGGPGPGGGGGGEFSPAMPGDSLEKAAADIAACAACGLSSGGIKAVPGEGAARPLVMAIGESPGAEEDEAGRPFAGKAGQLLDRMLASIGVSRGDNCYIATIVKCRPPGNREPGPEEIAACFPFLERQIRLLRPRIILCAGRAAAQSLLKTGKGIDSLRGEFAEWRIRAEEGVSEEAAVPVLCTFHPSDILRDESLKRPAWEDLKSLKAKIDSLNPLPGEA